MIITFPDPEQLYNLFFNYYGLSRERLQHLKWETLKWTEFPEGKGH